MKTIWKSKKKDIRKNCEKNRQEFFYKKKVKRNRNERKENVILGKEGKKKEK